MTYVLTFAVVPLGGMETVTSKDAGVSKSSELPDNIANMLDKDLDVEHIISEGMLTKILLMNYNLHTRSV